MKKWQRISLIAVLSLVVGYISFMSLYFITSEPKFCTLCHDTAPYVTSWKKSPHHKVKCLYCHEPRGFLGKIHSKSRGLNFVYQQWTGQYTIFAAGLVFEQNCIACHLGDYGNFPEAPKLDINHYNYLKQDLSCVKCHRDGAHDVNIFTDEKFTGRRSIQTGQGLLRRFSD